MNRIVALAAAAVVVFLAFLRPAAAPQPLSVAASDPKAQTKRPQPPVVLTAVVYVAGAVRRPGLYRLSDAMRADDAVRRAGGFAPNADAAAVNLAERIADGEEIRVPRIGESASAGRRARKKRPRARRQAPAESLDLNGAGASDLAQLPGVGETLAERIVEYRQLNGPFASVDELADVAGFTQRRVDALASYLYVTSKGR